MSLLRTFGMRVRGRFGPTRKTVYKVAEGLMRQSRRRKKEGQLSLGLDAQIEKSIRSAEALKFEVLKERAASNLALRYSLDALGVTDPDKRELVKLMVKTQKLRDAFALSGRAWVEKPSLRRLVEKTGQILGPKDSRKFLYYYFGKLDKISKLFEDFKI